MGNKRLLGIVALVIACLGLSLFAWDAFVERDSELDYAALAIGLSALVAAIAVLRKAPARPHNAE